jgi:hypothetical protein
LQDFLFEGHIDSDVWNIESPITGEFIIRKCMSTISSVELQLIRVETIIINDTEIREATEIQNLQIMDGHAAEDSSIPIFMLLPRYFTCASVSNRLFKVMPGSCISLV